jgi:MoaA/NifB/PqqE/SkfB family radical SAM enzyme
MSPYYFIPDELRFAVTRKCNGACRHCYNLSGKNTDRLSSDNIIQIIEEIHKLNPKFDRITLTGGEPLNEVDRVLKITRFAKTLNIRVRLVTRGWELSRELCEELKNSGVTKIQIGLDSSGDKIYKDDDGVEWDTYHSWLRNDKEGFKKTVNAIQTSLNAGLTVSVRYSSCKSNLNDLVNTYQFVSLFGVSKFKFRVLFPDGRAKQRLIGELISGSDLAKAQFNLIQASYNNKTEIEITQPCSFALPNRKKKNTNLTKVNSYKEACSCGSIAAYIDSNGDVKYCLFDENTFGNVCDDSFINIWNSAIAKQARDQRCPLDKSGFTCSSFKLLYEQFYSYPQFIQGYINEVRLKKSYNHVTI